MAGKGGAWKVAYADFVTAMMALFMVLWISSQDQKILVATSRYFQNPFNSPLQASSGVLDKDSNQLSSKNGAGQDSDSKKSATEAAEIDLQFLNSLAKDFYRLLHLDEDLQDKPIDIQVTSDGMRITLFDRARKPLFKEGSAEFTPWGDFAMQGLSWLIDRNKFHVVIEGHTRKGLVLTNPDYGPWELSSDRANAARRALTHYAVSPDLIERVTGFADTRPVPFQAEDSEGNQRITLSLSLGVRGAKKPSSLKPASPTTP
ncbi:flagellar motor protein MotB [Rariglobus hedericola]|uniref:OmpA family protein n=1 Tax=Rariglobus hedericola TaxID=2597822 RepID=A0A556QPS0_9BACT|nr:flagellar motor protein MotB [Rariglobus hedericola]TSJ78636.1 OmpA family protein [Rariglobus hedericola]